MAGRREADGRHRVSIERLEPPLAGDEDARRSAITAAFNGALGDAIRACPEQYFWYHRRWLNAPAEGGERPPQPRPPASS